MRHLWADTLIGADLHSDQYANAAWPWHELHWGYDIRMKLILKLPDPGTCDRTIRCRGVGLYGDETFSQVRLHTHTHKQTNQQTNKQTDKHRQKHRHWHWHMLACAVLHGQHVTHNMVSTSHGQQPSRFSAFTEFSRHIAGCIRVWPAVHLCPRA